MDHRSLHVFLLAVVIAHVQSAAPPQDLQFPLDETSASRQRRLYNESKPYLNDSLSELQKAMPELRGLKAGEKDLPTLLTRIGQEIETLSQQMPNLISREDVTQTRPGSRSGHSSNQQFNYLILVHRTTTGTEMSEYRTDLQNRSIGQPGEDPRAPTAHGFVLAWAFFHPTVRAESQFRYLGRQKIDGRNADVVAFSQTPGLVRAPGEIRVGSESFPMLYQGIAWIDESTFRILRLRTDLLAPQPEAQLEKLTTTVDFADVRIPHSKLRLWLPRMAVVEWKTVPRNSVDLSPTVASGRYIERHLYSHYHLYQVEVKIGS
ncbi:MAG TPA: hypothetical protein VK818_10345 [Methylomirabilota bacterium]|nr:hypothetical protein [Methylomirabilota bacterium]